MSLHYEFPVITNISDVLPHIDGAPEFIKVEKEAGFTVINYVQMGKETFPTVTDTATAIRRECRGLIFDTLSGNLVSRRFHKFFNLGERDDLTVDWSKPHRVVEKLDGSMISSIQIEGGIRWISKMGITTVSMQAETFAATRPEYSDFAQYCIYEGVTPIFEWCSRKQRIVVDHPDDRLVLLAVRFNSTGKYLPRAKLKVLADLSDIPLVETVDISTGNLSAFIDAIRAQEDAEGVIIQFDDGHMVKVKSDWYIALHRAKAATENERDVVGLILDEKIDDLLPILRPEEKARLFEFADDIRTDISQFAATVTATLLEARKEERTRKAFALSEHPAEETVRSACFRLWDSPAPDIWTLAWDFGADFIRKNLSNNASFAKCRSILRTARWTEQKEAA